MVIGTPTHGKELNEPQGAMIIASEGGEAVKVSRYTSLSPPCAVSKVMYSMRFPLDIHTWVYNPEMLGTY